MHIKAISLPHTNKSVFKFRYTAITRGVCFFSDPIFNYRMFVFLRKGKEGADRRFDAFTTEGTSGESSSAGRATHGMPAG